MKKKIEPYFPVVLFIMLYVFISRFKCHGVRVKACEQYFSVMLFP